METLEIVIRRLLIGRLFFSSVKKKMLEGLSEPMNYYNNPCQNILVNGYSVDRLFRSFKDFTE